MSRSYIVDDPVKQQFLLDREALVSGQVLAVNAGEPAG